jgi:hypothetical protein
LGPIDLDRVRISDVPGIVAFDTLSKAREVAEREPFRAMPQLIETVGQHNIIGWRGRYFTVHTGLGPIDLDRVRISDVPGIVAFDTLSKAREVAESLKSQPRWRRAALAARATIHRLARGDSRRTAK